ncbi:hypothetical protein TrRE_jg6337 [Triparma retinervis]|uniref:Protein farnesyltransferase/geranylgeranyltransferase type-1 subunit alpha n=1 Tax=Triparma retinervis TaxID=2557542 RepID=A0A9W7AS37_9STRA|nr:hypothetical protein TrRE_jg6337 [Triparma retinervis]
MVMGYFRACLATEELSERTLRLTAEVIDTNPANYTAWHCRRKCLAALGKGLAEEMEFTTEAGGENPKNYQIWYHRRAILDEHFGKKEDGVEELSYVDKVLEEDAKNYHAWSHRQYIIEKFELWGGEVASVEKKIDEDIRNNSAWNQRWFAVHLKASKEGGGEYSAKEEVDYALKIAAKDCHNESPFRYLLGVLQECWGDAGKVAEGPEDIARITKEARDKLGEMREQGSAHVHAALLDIAEKEGDGEEARELCEELRDKLDGIRFKYWDAKIKKMEEKAAK